MFRAILIVSLATALILTALWGSFFIFHIYPVFQDRFDWWMIPMFLTVLFFDALILLIGYAMIKASSEKIKEEGQSE